MKTLYLFGNGFDIAHGLETSYSSFRDFLAENHENFLRDFERIYDIEPLDVSEPWCTEETQKRWENGVLKELWKTFEEEIGHPDVEGMYDRAYSLKDEMPEEGVRDTLDVYWEERYGFSRKLQEYVLEWTKSIDSSVATVRKCGLVNNKSDLFINFNYTDTLERVYGIENVLHVHGGVPECTIVSPILGHGNKKLIDLYREKAKKAQEDIVEWEESIYNAIADYCEHLYKDTDKIILANDDFFTSLSDVDEVVLLGVSFGKVDTPYLQRIQRAIKPTTKWKVYYYDSVAQEQLDNTFAILGISKEYETCFLPSASFWDR